MSQVFSAVITEEAGGFVALNPDTGVASQGENIDEALKNLTEALSLYLEEVDDTISTKPNHPTLLTTVTV